MLITYLFAPIFGYLLAGGIKFALNTLVAGKLAFSNIGLGGMPSTHNAITSSTFFAIGFGEGFNAPATAVALMVCLVVGIDSLDLRRKIEQHAILICKELGKINGSAARIRTKLGHSPLEVAAGWSLGAFIGYFLVFIMDVAQLTTASIQLF